MAAASFFLHHYGVLGVMLHPVVIFSIMKKIVNFKLQSTACLAGIIIKKSQISVNQRTRHEFISFFLLVSVESS